ncbi:MAG: hypothetical protein ACXABY_12045, partial [Candidatus Thorarchaeota archaeon]
MGQPTSVSKAGGVKFNPSALESTNHPGMAGIIEGLRSLATKAGRTSVILEDIDVGWLRWRLSNDDGTTRGKKGDTNFNPRDDPTDPRYRQDGVSSEILAALWDESDQRSRYSPTVDISFTITEEGFVFVIYDTRRDKAGNIVDRIPLVSGTQNGLLRPVAQQGFSVDDTVTHGDYRSWVYTQGGKTYVALDSTDILYLDLGDRLGSDQLARHVEMQAFDPDFQLMLFELAQNDPSWYGAMSPFGKMLYGDGTPDSGLEARLDSLITARTKPPTETHLKRFIEQIRQYVKLHDEMNTRVLQLSMIEIKIQEAIVDNDAAAIKLWEGKRKLVIEQISKIDADMFTTMSKLTKEYAYRAGDTLPNHWSRICGTQITMMCRLSMGVTGESATEMAVTMAGALFTGMGLNKRHENYIPSTQEQSPFAVAGLKTWFVGFFASLMNVMSDAKYALESLVLEEGKRLQPAGDGKTLIEIEDMGGVLRPTGNRYVVDVIDAKMGLTGKQDAISTDVYCMIYLHTTAGDVIPIPLKTISKKSPFYRKKMDIDRVRISLDDGTWLILDIATSLVKPSADPSKAAHSGPTTYRTPIWPLEASFKDSQYPIADAMEHTLHTLEKQKIGLQSKASTAMLRSLTASRHLINDPTEVHAIREMLLLATVNPNLAKHLDIIREVLTHWMAMNPGPLMSDIDFGRIWDFMSWWTVEYVPNPEFIVEDILINVGPFEPLDINEHLQDIISGWLADFVHSESEDVTEEMKSLALSSVAKGQMGYAPLADDWPYPPYQVAEWRYVGEGTDEGWYSLGSPEQRTTDMNFGYAPISQKVVVNRDIKTSKMQLFLLDLGDIYNETVEFYVQVWHDDEMVSGSAVLRKEGLTEVQFTRQIDIKAGDTVEIFIPIQETRGKVVLCHKDLLGYKMSSRDGGLSVERTPISDYIVFLKLFDVEKAGVSGWQKTGIRFEANYSSIYTVDYIIGDAKNYLLTYLRSNPDDRLPRTWIAATMFNTTNNETTVAYEEYEFRQTQIYTDIPDASQKYTPVYIYGEENVDVDLLINSLRLSGQRVVKKVTTNELIDIIVSKRSGMLVFLTDDIPYQVLTIDSGASYIHEWLRSGNQIVTAGVLPFENVKINSNSLSMYDYLFYSERATLGTSRFAEFNDVTNPSNLGGDGTSSGTATTYQCYDSSETNDTIDMTLGPTGGVDDYMSFKVYMPYNDGSMTWMFPISIPDVNRTSQYFQSIDIYMDGMPIFERFALDQLRNPTTGLGVGKVFYSDGAYEGNRLFVQHIKNVVQSDGKVDANFIFYLTVRNELVRGTHILEIRDCDDNGVDQKISFLKLNNLISYENTYRQNIFRDIQTQYQGIPSIGAGAFAVTGRDIVVSAPEIGRTGIEYSGVVSIKPSEAFYAVDLDSTPIYRTYAVDSTGEYGEATVRVGSGLITMADMVLVNQPDPFYLVNKINYLLT